jgi:magnesium dechelatase
MLTHPNITAELFLTIGPDCNESQICGWYTRLIRDLLAEWEGTDEEPVLHVYCHVSGGFVFGSAPLRYKIFQDELPLVLEALRYGDSSFFAPHPQLDNAPSGFTSSQQCLSIM